MDKHFWTGPKYKLCVHASVTKMEPNCGNESAGNQGSRKKKDHIDTYSHRFTNVSVRPLQHLQ